MGGTSGRALLVVLTSRRECGTLLVLLCLSKQRTGDGGGEKKGQQFPIHFSESPSASSFCSTHSSTARQRRRQAGTAARKAHESLLASSRDKKPTRKAHLKRTVRLATSSLPSILTQYSPHRLPLRLLVLLQHPPLPDRPHRLQHLLNPLLVFFPSP
jgi:hypothetical protein